MKIGILESGTVARTVGGRLAELGHEIMFGTRDMARTLARKDPDAFAHPPFKDWQAQHSQVRLSGFTETGRPRRAADQRHLRVWFPLSGKILINMANPLDFSQSLPPTLFIKDTDSLAEQVRRSHPELNVVKIHKTMNAQLMVSTDHLAAGEHSFFLSGNDAVQFQNRSLRLRRSFRDIFPLTLPEYGV